MTKKRLNLVAQGKGGVGKSFIASLISQYTLDKGKKVVGIDTDPNNSTFTTIKKLDNTLLKILSKEGKIDERSFDKLIEKLMGETEEVDYVVDNGATSFLPLIKYLKEGEIFDLLSEKYEIVVHVPIVGGQAQDVTLLGLEQLVSQFNTVLFVVWINNFQGEIVGKKGESFEKMDVYKRIEKHLFGVIDIEKLNPDTTGMDVKDMTTKSLTFGEVMESEEFSLMAKQRIKTFQKKIYAQMDNFL